MESQRPASEKHASGRRESAGPPRKSIASSSENSNKSRSRGHGSRHSSRPTSCTIVDPSRPMRHYRIKSTATVPTVGINSRDVDDTLAFHFRSCSLFQNPTYHSDLPSPTWSGYGSTNTDMPNTPDMASTHPIPHDHTDTIEIAPENNEETVTFEPTTMHWMTDRTRKREYERIDKANSRLRGLIRKIIPRCVSGPPPAKFYEDDKSDMGSVRRYRMNLSEDEEDFDEKRSSLIRNQTGRVPKSRPNTAATPKKSWCRF